MKELEAKVEVLDALEEGREDEVGTAKHISVLVKCFGEEIHNLSCGRNKLNEHDNFQSVHAHD